MSTTLHKDLVGTDLHVNRLHADTHVVAGTDPLVLAESQVTALITDLAAKKADNVSATDKILGRATAGAGAIEEIACTAAGRAILDDANAAAQLATLGTAAYSEGTWTPTLVGATIVGSNPTLTGTYKRIGNLVFAHCIINAGAGGNTSVALVGGGTTTISLPVNAAIGSSCIVTDVYADNLGVGNTSTAVYQPPTVSAKTIGIILTATYCA